MTKEMNASSPERTVVGFDIRKSSSLNNLFLTSYDDEVRYEDIYEKFHEYRSGLSLFYVDPSSIVSLEMPLGARIIAFDLPTDLVLHLSSGNVSNPQPLPQIDINNGEWEFVGFDVVDPITQTSAFHGFDPPLPVGKMMEGCSIDFNDHGLLKNIESALKVVEYCNVIVPEHSPFSACGVWLKHINRRVEGRF
jgi:hypothetical protein